MSQKEIVRINKIIGQLNGIKTMVENNKYCINILQQTKAAKSAIKSLEKQILENHLKSCVYNANKSNGEFEEKIQEILSILIEKE